MYPGLAQILKVITDASNGALRAVLSQLKNVKYRPISLSSGTLSDNEKIYSTIENEIVGIVWATHTFHQNVGVVTGAQAKN